MSSAPVVSAICVGFLIIFVPGDRYTGDSNSQKLQLRSQHGRAYNPPTPSYTPKQPAAPKLAQTTVTSRERAAKSHLVSLEKVGDRPINRIGTPDVCVASVELADFLSCPPIDELATVRAQLGSDSDPPATLNATHDRPKRPDSVLRPASFSSEETKSNSSREWLTPSSSLELPVGKAGILAIEAESVEFECNPSWRLKVTKKTAGRMHSLTVNGCHLGRAHLVLTTASPNKVELIRIEVKQASNTSPTGT